MKIFFEGYHYNPENIETILEESLYKKVENDSKRVIPFVGYYFSTEINDSIFILPKVFINIDDGKPLAFGKYDVETIIDAYSDTLKEDKFNEVVFELSTWLYRAIAHYVERNEKTSIANEVYIHNVINVKGDESLTFIEIALDLIKFHKENKNLFTFISIYNASGRSKIHWDKTINRTTPIINKGKPYYVEPISKDKTINYDEELVVLFYSVLAYLQSKYSFKIKVPLQYELIKPSKIQEMIKHGKGLRLLKKLRHKYFKDEFVSLWNLLYIFFDKEYRVATKNHKKEKLLVSNFDRVFEDMVDQLISDPTVPNNLIHQADNKIVDHIFKNTSLIPDGEIFYVGDSKYYPEGIKIDGTAFFKQYTYAKNIIQVNLDLFNNGILSKPLRYVDTLTEGYNITPNFFIIGKVDPSNIDYTNIHLKNIGLSIEEGRRYHWKNRLFDRDTLLLQSYNINFLYVMSTYVNQIDDFATKRKIWKRFTTDLIEVLNNNYIFFLITPIIPIEDFVNKYFKILNGKIYRSNDEEKSIWLAFEKNNVDQKVLDTISSDCKMEKNVKL